MNSRLSFTYIVYIILLKDNKVRGVTPFDIGTALSRVTSRCGVMLGSLRNRLIVYALQYTIW